MAKAMCEDDGWLQRATDAANALDEETRRAIVKSNTYASICPPSRLQPERGWAIVDEQGVDDGFDTERDAENSIIIGTGMFNDV